jgi:hypothetical protein
VEIKHLGCQQWRNLKSPYSSSRCHCLSCDTVWLGAVGPVLFIGATLLVSIVLIQPIPIIFGAGRLMTTDTVRAIFGISQLNYDDLHQRCPPIYHIVSRVETLQTRGFCNRRRKAAAKIRRCTAVACHHTRAFSLDAVVATTCLAVPSPGCTRHRLFRRAVPLSHPSARLRFSVQLPSHRHSPALTSRQLCPAVLLLHNQCCCIFGSTTSCSIPCSTIFCVAPPPATASHRTVPNQTGNIMF